MQKTGRKLSLNENQIAILETRIALAKVGIFTLTQIGTGWDVSLTTIHRYKSPEYREASRKYSKKSYLSYQKSLNQGLCFRCREDLEHHERCSECTILLHAGTLFGDTIDGKICTGCAESNKRQL